MTTVFQFHKSVSIILKDMFISSYFTITFTFKAAQVIILIIKYVFCVR